MQKVAKVYQSIHYQYYAGSVTVDGKVIRLTFQGGVRMGSYRVNGKYMTDDPKIQEAIEKSGGFNKDYKLIETIPLEGAVEEPETPKVPEIPAEPVVETPVEEPETETPVEEPETENVEVPAGEGEKLVCEATTVQEAKEWLCKNFEEATHRGIPNGPAVKQFAAEHGVQLPNLK